MRAAYQSVGLADLGQWLKKPCEEQWSEVSSPQGLQEATTLQPLQG